MRETWHPAGVCGVITAFNFPVAPWCWNAALALVCGDPVIWKPSEKTPLSALATQNIFDRAVERFGDAPAALSQVVDRTAEAGEALVDNRDVAARLRDRIDAHGPRRRAARRGALRQCILELGGNNAMIVAPSADLEMALRAIVFSAVGTAGQRCTSLRRLIVHEDVCASLMSRLKTSIGPRRSAIRSQAGTLVGPLIDGAASTNAARARRRRATRAASSPAASASCETATRTPITCVPRSSKCPRRRRSSAKKRSRRSST